jgi:hypothetical protein
MIMRPAARSSNWLALILALIRVSDDETAAKMPLHQYELTDLCQGIQDLEQA